MIQQVNLYRNADQADYAFLKNPYALISLGACLLLIIVSVVSEYNLQQQKQQRQDLEQQLQIATAHLEDVQTRFPQKTLDNALTLQLQQAQQQYQNLAQIMELLSDDQSDQALGFSRYLSALADQADRDIWLTRIRFDSINNDISLHGSTFKPEQIPALLQRLQNSPAFKGRHFARLSIKQNPENNAQTDFSVSSNLKPDPENSDAQH